MSRQPETFEPNFAQYDIDAETIDRLIAKGRRERSKAVHEMFASLFRKRERDAAPAPATPLGGHAAPC